MSKITLQYDIANQTPGDAVPVNSNFTRIEDHINQEVIERGGSVAMTAPLVLAGAPAADLHAATKAYVDGLVPIGAMQLYAGTGDPVGGKWFICDGRVLEAAAYPVLFAAIGTAYGGSGGNFNLPDMRGRMPLGAGTDLRGAVGGSRDLVVPSHNHTINHTHATATSGFVSADHSHSVNFGSGNENQAHNHTISWGEVWQSTGEASDNVNVFSVRIGDGITIQFKKFPTTSFPSGTENQAHNHNVTGGTSGISANHQHNVDVPTFNGNSGTSGVSATDANLPPYVAVNYMIKVL